MEPANQNKNESYFFRVTSKYALGTPEVIAASDRTIDMPFQQLAEDHDLQAKLQLASRVFIKPSVMYAEPLGGRELHHAVAVFLSAFASDPTERQQRANYLANNGTVRLLVTDKALLGEIRDL